MKNVLSILLLFIAFSCGKAQTKQEQEPPIKVEEKTSYYLIRHAEKDRTVDTNNPDLLKKGQERAQKWAKYFKTNGITFDAVYSTNYKRTKQTATPTAKQNKLDLIIYKPFKINLHEFKAKTKGQTVLIVGHSDTTPKFVNNLIGEDKYAPINDRVNSNLFVVTITGTEITSELLNIEHYKL